MGFPLDRGSVEDGILTCHWHHARFDLQSGCTFDLWADDAPIFPVEVRGDEVWVKILIGDEDPVAHWRQRDELKIVDRPSDSTIGRVLKNTLKPHRREQWVIPPKANSAFVAAMEDVLAVYTRPRDPDRPLVCLDETSK